MSYLMPKGECGSLQFHPTKDWTEEHPNPAKCSSYPILWTRVTSPGTANHIQKMMLSPTHDWEQFQI